MLPLLPALRCSYNCTEATKQVEDSLKQIQVAEDLKITWVNACIFFNVRSCYCTWKTQWICTSLYNMYHI